MRMADKTQEFINPDFVPRSYSRPINELITICAAAVCIVTVLSFFPQWVGGESVVRVISICLIMLLTAFIIFRKMQHNDLVMATEFENLLFSAAASLGSNFCIFLKSDGTIVYANDATRRMFPRFAYEQNRALENLLDEGKVENIDRDKLFSAMANAKKEVLIFAIADTTGNKRDYIIILEPLQRPAGYFVLRGREYYSERKAVEKISSKLQKTSSEKIVMLVSNVPSPVFITNENGTIEFVNPAMESLLGYHDGDMVDHKLTLQKIIYHADGYETGEFEPCNFIGTVLFRKRDGNVLKAQLDQKLCATESGEICGCYGVVLD
jgi:PAS domain S-box-containing protein